MKNPGVQVQVPVNEKGEPEKLYTLTVDTAKVAEYAQTRGYWRATPNKARTGNTLDFFPYEGNALLDIKTGEYTSRSFLPYAGIMPNTPRLDTTVVGDFRQCSYKNIANRKCKLEDYMPKPKVKKTKHIAAITPEVTAPISALDAPEVVNATVDETAAYIVSHDVDMLAVTLKALMTSFGLNLANAVQLYKKIEQK